MFDAWEKFNSSLLPNLELLSTTYFRKRWGRVFSHLSFSAHIACHDWSLPTLLSIGNTTKILMRFFFIKMPVSLLDSLHTQLLFVWCSRNIWSERELLKVVFGWRWNQYTALPFVVFVSSFRSWVQLSFEIPPFYVHFVSTFLLCWKINPTVASVRQKNVVYPIFRPSMLTFR